MSQSNNVIVLTEWKKEYTKKKKKEEQDRSIPPLKAFQPNQYYIHPEKGAMIHVLFITDKSDIFNNYMIYVMEDPTGAFYCAKVQENTCDGWHELHPDVFRHEVEKHRSDPTPPKAS